MRTAKDLHLALILFTAQAYMETEIKDGMTDDTIHKRIVAGIEAWKRMRRFSNEELLLIQQLNKQEIIKDLTHREISFIVYALELLKHARNDHNYIIGVGSRILKRGSATFILGLVKTKAADLDRYNKIKDVITTTEETARDFYKESLLGIEKLQGVAA